MTSSFADPSGLAGAYNRYPAQPGRSRILFVEGGYIAGAELNELQSIEAGRNARVGNLIAKDGDRITDATIIVTVPSGATTATVNLSSGQIYVRGDVRNVAAATITGISLTTTVIVGVRLVTQTLTYQDDPTLLGLMPGSWAEGQPGAARQSDSIAWALSTDGGAGDFIPVYTLVNGALLDQTPPPALSGVNAAIAQYDRDANGSYIVSGCEVTPLGKAANGTDQVFSVQAGVANINGFKRSRNYALRHQQTESPDLEAVPAEPHTYSGTDPITIVVNRPPIASVTSVIVVKQVTETVTRGSVTGGSDALQHASVVAIVSVTQGSTNFAAGTDYALGTDAVSWSPSGSEPANASTYTVTYRYNAAVTPSTITPTSLTVAGGVASTTALVSYLSKIPRIDLLCLDSDGNTAYVPGVSARSGGLAPLTPAKFLKLAEIANDWLHTPVVTNNGTHNYTYDQIARIFARVVTMLDEFNRLNLVTAATAGNPVAKQGIFTDSFSDDSYRDQGAPQTAATVNGSLQLAVDLLTTARFLTAPVSMAYVEVALIRQEQATSSMAINPYATLTRMPAGLTLTPATDFFTDTSTVWTSPVTQDFAATQEPPVGSTATQITQTTIAQVVETRDIVADRLRQISINFVLSGFGVGERLASLTFDGVSVLPVAPLVGDAHGQISGSFVIPPNIPTGTRLVVGTGAAGSFAQAYFIGSGTIDVTTMQQVTLIQRIAPVINITNLTDVTNVTNVSNVTNVTNVNNTLQQTIVNNTLQQTVVNNITNVTNVTNVTPPAPEDQGIGRGRGTGGGVDPLAETFTLDADACIVGVDFKIMTIGDPTRGIRVQICTTVAGIPETNAIAEAFVDVSTLTAGQWVQARFAAPVFIAAGVERAIVLMTDDPHHAVAVAKLGDVDTATQTFVASQPYTVGVLLASSNHVTWTPINDADMTFRLIAAAFTATTKTVPLGTLALGGGTDVVARWTADLPNVFCSARVEMVRADGTVTRMTANQTVSFTDFINETVTFRAVLTGTANVAPTLFPGVAVGVGKLRTSGTYITRAFTFGSAVKVDGVVNALLPSGAALTVDCDATDNNWNSMASTTSFALGSGWTEMKFEKSSFTAQQGRVRLTLSGTPAARPVLTGLRAYTI